MNKRSYPFCLRFYVSAGPFSAWRSLTVVDSFITLREWSPVTEDGINI